MPAQSARRNPPAPTIKLRLEPRHTGQLLVTGAEDGGVLICENHPPARGGGGENKDKIAWIWNPAERLTDRLVPEPFGPVVSNTSRRVGGGVQLIDDQRTVIVDGFVPGDATITGANSVGARKSVQVEVRARSAGPVPRAPLTKLEPGSKFFSASRQNGGEFDPAGIGEGRPVNPRRGGRLINLGGEQETPEFEDYQVSLGFSGYKRSFTGGKFVFRPLVDDSDPSMRVKDKEVSHICMRGNPFTDDFINAIKRIAAANCLFTLSSGDPNHVQKAINTVPGTVLEKDIPKGHVVIELRV